MTLYRPGQMSSNRAARPVIPIARTVRAAEVAAATGLPVLRRAPVPLGTRPW